jgi:hypothetical protein
MAMVEDACDLPAGFLSIYHSMEDDIIDLISQEL